MADKGIQNISKAAGIKFDGVTYVKDTWYTLTNQLSRRNTTLIVNQGVNNDMATGILYMSLREDATLETAAVNTASVMVLKAGDSYETEIDNNIRINVQADTTNVVCYVQELDAPLSLGDTY